MESLLTPYSPYTLIAQAQDMIGFDNLLVGRLPQALIDTMEQILAPLGSHS